MQMCPTFICGDISFYSLQCNSGGNRQQTLNCHTVLLSLNRLAHINYKLSGKSIYTCYMTNNMWRTGAKNNYIVMTTRWAINSLQSTAVCVQSSCPLLLSGADAVSMATLPPSPGRPAPTNTDTIKNISKRLKHQIGMCMRVLTFSSVPSSISQDSKHPFSCW